jgi:hypothetical protein
MPEFVVRVIFEGYSRAWGPLGVFFGDSLELVRGESEGNE